MPLAWLSTLRESKVPRHIVWPRFDFDTQSGFIARAMTSQTARAVGGVGLIAAKRVDQLERAKPSGFGEQSGLIEMPIRWSRHDYPDSAFVRTPTAVLPSLQSARTVMEKWLADFRYLEQTFGWGVLTYTMHPYV